MVTGGAGTTGSGRSRSRRGSEGIKVPPVTASTNSGWQHISVAVTNVDGGNIANWAAINAVDALVYDGNWTNSASMKLGFTNFKLTGGP